MAPGKNTTAYSKRCSNLRLASSYSSKPGTSPAGDNANGASSSPLVRHRQNPISGDQGGKASSEASGEGC